ncbi:MAG: prenyltransferase/squalene oxidase repeat-containing protein [Planctomycetota bacterium]
MRSVRAVLAILATATVLSAQPTDAGEPRAVAQDPDSPLGRAPGVGGLTDVRWRDSCDAADRGLAWLVEAQHEDGYWEGTVGHKQQDSYIALRDPAVNRSLGEGHVGVTALCGMALLAGGHLPDRGEYGDSLRSCVDYLLEHITDTGLVTDGGTRMYSHAFATLFLAEIAGMDPDDRIRTGLERAVHLIVDSQNQQGGWRYNAFSPEADMSVTVCQLQALRAARNIGLRIPKETIDDAVDYVLRARTRQGLFYYRTQGRNSRRKDREFAINAAAATALLTAGVLDRELQEPILEFLRRDYEQRLSRYYPDHFYFWYGNYYACQAFFHAGDERFSAYHRRVVEDLLPRQQSDGRWINSVGPGDAFSTAVASILLQVPKQYLPIFQR